MSVLEPEPQKVWQWLRWDKPDDPADDLNKWHLMGDKVDGEQVTACGHHLRPLDEPTEYFGDDVIPVDDNGVCLHCLRYQEFYNRAEEATI